MAVLSEMEQSQLRLMLAVWANDFSNQVLAANENGIAEHLEMLHADMVQLVSLTHCESVMSVAQPSIN